MTGDGSAIRNWKDMKYDILLKIFMALNVVELATVSSVCSSWHRACKDPVLWRKLDMSKISFHHANISTRAYTWSDEQSSSRLIQFLKNALNLSKGHINCLIFHFCVFIKDEHLLTAAERSPNLKRLVLPAWSQLSEVGIHQAMQLWEGLESMTIPFISSPYYILAAIGKHCKNFSELKITCDINVGLADAIIKYVPRLKMLSLRCTMVKKEALVLLMNGLEHLELLNISHSLIIEEPDADASNVVLYRKCKLSDILKDSFLKKLITCQGGTCIMCKRSDNNLSIGCYDYQEALWREDEISSLAH